MRRSVDLYCRVCDCTLENRRCGEDEVVVCLTCEQPMEQVWWTPRRRNAQWSDQDAVVVFVNPQAKDPQTRVRYPGRNTVKTPPGYARVELKSLRAVERFEREHHVRNEAVWFDQGSGRGFDDTYRGKSFT